MSAIPTKDEWIAFRLSEKQMSTCELVDEGTALAEIRELLGVSLDFVEGSIRARKNWGDAYDRVVAQDRNIASIRICSIDRLNISRRLNVTLRRLGIKTLDRLLEFMNEHQSQDFPKRANFGKVTQQELRDWYAQHQLPDGQLDLGVASKSVTVTLSWQDHARLQQLARTKGASVAKVAQYIIVERLRDEHTEYACLKDFHGRAQSPCG
jgi:hypothetical protein